MLYVQLYLQTSPIACVSEHEMIFYEMATVSPDAEHWFDNTTEKTLEKCMDKCLRYRDCNVVKYIPGLSGICLRMETALHSSILPDEKSIAAARCSYLSGSSELMKNMPGSFGGKYSLSKENLDQTHGRIELNLFDQEWRINSQCQQIHINSAIRNDYTYNNEPFTYNPDTDGSSIRFGGTLTIDDNAYEGATFVNSSSFEVKFVSDGTVSTLALEWHCYEVDHWNVVTGTSGGIGVRHYRNNYNQELNITSDCLAVQVISNQFSTESCCDYVFINRVGYSGSAVIDQHIPSANFTVSFSTNGNGTFSGFIIYWFCTVLQLPEKTKPEMTEPGKIALVL